MTNVYQWNENFFDAKNAIFVACVNVLSYWFFEKINIKPVEIKLKNSFFFNFDLGKTIFLLMIEELEIRKVNGMRKII